MYKNYRLVYVYLNYVKYFEADYLVLIKKLKSVKRLLIGSIIN